ncbi:hypothetical protein [Pseudarthrobacter oxydans]|uniref:hypothetical protein n=1 Tax=Pseudarthrobacter oxydans TaxID=1671 RepID=UPI0038133E06
MVLPLLTSAAAVISGFVLPHADQLIAGTALLMGALLAAFAQIAGWRERLLARAKTTDGVEFRALNEAAAHILVAVVVSLAATVVLALLANLDVERQNPSVCYSLVLRALTALGVAAFTYVSASMVIVVNLLWDAYERSGRIQPSGDSGIRQGRPD